MNPADSLRATSRAGTATRAARTLTNFLLVGEAALATALLVGAGVLVASFGNLMAVDPGLDVRNVVTAAITLPEFSFRNRDARRIFAGAAASTGTGARNRARRIVRRGPAGVRR